MTRLHRLAILAAAPALALLALGALAARSPTLALINESPSLPQGLYLRDPYGRPDRGAIVALPQPAAVRPYLARWGTRVHAGGSRRLMAPGNRIDQGSAQDGGDVLPSQGLTSARPLKRAARPFVGTVGRHLAYLKRECGDGKTRQTLPGPGRRGGHLL